MKNHFVFAVAAIFSVSVYSQSTRFYSDPQAKFKEAKEYFQKEQYSLAYPLLKELQNDLRETDKVNTAISVQEVNYYATVCALKQNEGRAEDQAQAYIDLEKNTARVQMMSFHLGEYYYRRQDFSNAARQYEQTNIVNLGNREIADMKFHQGYAYFTLQRFNEAKPLFNTIRTIKDDPNYLDANYYYGFLAFRDRQYSDALASFRIVENEKDYATVVPYYIAQIHYIQGNKEEAIAYVQNKLKSGANTQYYDLELKQLIGHAHFERKEYAMALPYLEDYVRRSQKVRREDLYELSYSYYQANQLTKAIEGFKQLSGKDDSLSQHSMYLLGDAYLKTGQKSNARNAFLFCASNSSNPTQKEISRFQYAKLSYELGYQDESLNSLRAFLNDYPNSDYNTEAKDLLVAVLTSTNNYRDALALLEDMSNPTPNAKRLYPRILYGRATEYINDGQLDEADALLDKALKDPNNAPVLPLIHFWKGEIAYRNNNLDNAIKHYNAYVSAGSPASGDANPNHVRYNLGYAYLRKENYAAAQSFFEPLAKNPALNSNELTQDAYIRTADVLFMQKEYNRAKTMYDNVIRFSWPAEDYATFQNAMIAGIRSTSEKITLLNTMNRKFPTSSLVTDANMEVANTYMADERFREALPFLNNVLKGDGNNSLKPQAYLKLGIAYYNLNNNSEALKQYKTLINQYPNSPEAGDALDNVKSIYVEDGKPGEYADFMRQAGRPISVDTEDSLTYFAAETQYQNGNINAALTGFNKYLERFPDGVYSLDADFYSAEIYNSKKDWNNALRGYEAVAADAPNTYAERAILAAARVNFFEVKNYNKAENYYGQLKQLTGNQENRLEAMRGLLRSQYQLQKWTEAVENAKELTNEKGSSTDDKALANMAIAKSYQVEGQYDLAIANYKSVVTLNKAALAAEARYEIANSWFALGKMQDAEKGAFETINKSGSYDFWVTRAYILLGDIYFRQKDYFNAKATFQSIVDNSINSELKGEAQRKLNQVMDEESKSSKVNG
ncbi:MAG TPA: tetratricopeptide repeat protein [Chitinophagaceae bacterium]|nr:tetratricopeptide repeat protein [Chitinophagaceae bacterium]